MAAAAKEGEVFEWEKGVLELVPCTTAYLSMEPIGTGAPSITTWDFKEAVKTVTKGASDPLFIDLEIGRERSVAKIGFEDAAMADLIISTLDKRVVPIGRARLKVEASRYVDEQGSGGWKTHFFKAEADASSAVQDELFKRGTPGQRPDTLVLPSLPCKWFGMGQEGGEEGLGKEKGDAGSCPRLNTLMQSLGWWVVAVEAHTGDPAASAAAGGRLTFDAYVQLRKLSEVQAALAFFKDKALRYVPSGKVVSLSAKVDTTGFMVESAVARRKDERKREAEARRAYNSRLQELSKDREAVEVLVEEVMEESRRGDVEELEPVRRTMAILEELVKKARRLEGQAHGEASSSAILEWGSSKALKELSSSLSQIKSHLTSARRVVKESEVMVREAQEKEAQERRSVTVREARVARAKELKPIEDGWRLSLSSDRLKAASSSSYGARLVSGAQSSLDSARELVLSKFEGPMTEEEMEGHVKKLVKAVKDAQAAVDKAEAGLELQATATELEVRLHKAMEEDLDEEEEEEPEDKDGVMEEEEVDGAKEKSSWRWPFPRLLLDDPAFLQSKKRAEEALGTLEEVRAGGDPQGEGAIEAVKQLRFHVESVLTPKRRRHRAVVPRAKHLDRVAKKWREVVQSSEGVKRAMEAAETAVKRAYKGMGADAVGAAKGGSRSTTATSSSSKGDDELIQVMEAALERVETAAANVAQRRKQEAEARTRAEEGKRRRQEEEERQAEAREREEREKAEKEIQLRLADLERRKAFLEGFGRIREARKRLRAYRQHVMTQPPPTMRLLQAGGLRLMVKKPLTQQQEGEEAGNGEEASQMTGMSPVPILSRWRPWASRQPVLEESAANAVSAYYWDELHDKEEEEEEEELKYPPELRLKTVVVKISQEEARQQVNKRSRQQEGVDEQSDAQQARPRMRGAAVVVSTEADKVVAVKRMRGSVVVVEK